MVLLPLLFLFFVPTVYKQIVASRYKLTLFLVVLSLLLHVRDDFAFGRGHCTEAPNDQRVHRCITKNKLGIPGFIAIFSQQTFNQIFNNK